jgi:hypothetical protein
MVRRWRARFRLLSQRFHSEHSVRALGGSVKRVGGNHAINVAEKIDPRKLSAEQSIQLLETLPMRGSVGAGVELSSLHEAQAWGLCLLCRAPACSYRIHLG